MSEYILSRTDGESSLQALRQLLDPATDAQVSLAANTVGSSTCSSDFAGKIYSYRRLTHGFPGFADPGASQ